MKKLLVSVFMLLLFISAKADLTVYFLDVGQGDAALLTCDGETMLIDGGPTSAAQFIFSFLRENIDSLDYIIATHPHLDHIGGISSALNAVPVGVIFSPVLQWDSHAFDSILHYAELQGTPIVIPSEGDSFDLGNATVTILHCWPEAWDHNDMSIVARVDYGSVSFLFTGDAETMSEYMMLDNNSDLQATVLKVGHHGSRSSSSKEFIDAVNPRFAIISCGIGNTYGHPHPEVMETLKNRIIYRTDDQGTIVFKTDGNTIDIRCLGK